MLGIVRETIWWSLSNADPLPLAACKAALVRSLSHHHHVWDVHCDNNRGGKERWWVIINPTNLCSQDQFPNMDYALTFHVGLCLRIPRSEKPKFADIPLEPFAAPFRMLAEAIDALATAQAAAVHQHQRPVPGSASRVRSCPPARFL